MGALADFLRLEFEVKRGDRENENGPPPPAKVANPANPLPNFSDFSNFSSPADPVSETEISNFSNFSSAPSPIFEPVALQREADRRNMEALRQAITDRWCRCGALAELAWPLDGKREVWRCPSCAPTAGRA
jgi:hypothetical protein